MVKPSPHPQGPACNRRLGGAPSARKVPLASWEFDLLIALLERLQTSIINATLSGTSMTGTEVDTSSVNVSGTTTPVGTLTITSDFAVTKQ